MANTAYFIGRYFEKKALTFLKRKGFTEINWVSVKKPNSHFDITARRNNKLYRIEVRYTKSKKFQITETKFKELEKLKNVLFLLISKKQKRLISMADIKKEADVSINSGQLTGLEIKKREPVKDESSFLHLFSNLLKVRIIDFLMDNYPLDFSKHEIARNLNVSPPLIFNSWDYLQKLNIVKVVRRFGKTKLYTLNSSSAVVKKIVELEQTLISEAMEKAAGSRRKPLAVSNI